MMQDMCILVVSCDKYADCWTPFSDCMRKFWPDCPYPVYLCTESGEPEAGTVYSRALHSPNPSWTGRLREVCAQIQEEYIFITLEDHWLAGKIDQEKIVADVTLLRQHKEVGVVYLDYLTPTMPIWSKDGGYREIPTGTQYRLAAGPSVWRKEFLCIACAEDADAWNFERVKSFSPETYSYTVLTCKDSQYQRIHPAGSVQRGKWQLCVRSFAAQNGLNIDTSHRPFMGFKDTFVIKAKSIIFNLNPSLIVKIQNWLYHRSQKK